MRLEFPKRLSLRKRVTFALVSLVAVFVLVLGVLAVLSLDEQEDDLADAWVLAEAKRLAAYAERGDLHRPENAELFTPTSTLRAWLIDLDGRALPQPLPAHLRALRDGVHWQRLDGGELHIAVMSTARGKLVVEYDARATEDKVADFALFMLPLGALCIGVALIVSRRVASVVVGPIERLSEQLSNWAPATAATEARAFDEEERLFDAFHRVQSRFEEVVAREREFVANVRHEIKTPLTALRTDLEMLALAARDDPARLQRLERALSMVDVVNASLESARVVSERGTAAAQDVALAECVDDAWASLQNDLGIGTLKFENAVPRSATVRVDRHALLTILRNLIRNAAEHATGARCVVSFAHGCIEVADDGPGIAPQDLPFVFERYYRGRYKDASGIDPADRGLGLAIARQVADLSGWQLTAHSEPGAGARFALRIG